VGGTISVVRWVREGSSRMSLSRPVRQSPEYHGDSQSHSPPPRRTVLVVDDDPRNRSLLRAYLGHLYDVREAADAASALRAVEEGPVDLVLLDVMMPGTSGYEVCKKLKARPGPELLPVILLTALGEQEDRNTGLEAGADDFLTKPVERRELLLRVAAFIRLREQQALIVHQMEELVELAALKDDLVSLIVHDLRNPLASVFGILHLVGDELTDATVRADLDLALQSAVRLRDTLDDLLQVRLLEERRLPVERTLAPVRDVVRDAVGSVAGAARDRGVEIKVEIGPDVQVPMDRRLVRRALENLMMNAVKYSPAGVPVDVAWRPTADGLELVVSDRGSGIPPMVRDRLFEKFGGVVAHKTNQRRGYGLGLYQVRLVADAHGGTVRAGDREGGGTTFAVVLPLAAAAGPAPSPGGP
jgi:two-component system sensor histidine kinase/response regulator